MTHLDSAQLDRAAGVLLALGCGDALGAGYEFGPPLPPDVGVAMIGGGPFRWAPGEWTDDTAMAIAIAEVAAAGVDLRSADALDAIAARWSAWARDANDVGAQTRSVLQHATAPTGAALTASAEAHHRASGRSGGNGSLMRTAPVALAYLDDPGALDEAARTISALTHHDPEAGEACAIWCAAIRHAVLHGTFDGLPLAVDALPTERASVWSARLEEAEANPPAYFEQNGWVVQALQAAWSAIVRTQDATASPADGSPHLRLALEAAVRGGRDTDTVAAIAGALLGARWGASAVPASWRAQMHGWPGLRGDDLVRLGLLTAQGDSRGNPRPVRDRDSFMRGN